ncbi:MAG: DUF885 domain-containing protein [Acidimicrobiia bacterium]
MVTVHEIADRYIDDVAALDPIAATAWGLPGNEGRLPDLSPDGLGAVVSLQRATLAALDAAPQTVRSERVAADVMAERLTADIEQFDAGEHYRSLRVLGGLHGSLRQVFDLMPLSTEDDWAAAVDRLNAVPAAIESYRHTLAEGVDRGLVSARRQVLACASQCEAWSGNGDFDTSFFAGVTRRYDGDQLAGALARGAERAASAYAAFAGWLRDDYAAAATPIDPVGRDRYRLAARAFNGADLDLDDTYAWGWDELRRIEQRIVEVCNRIVPGSTFAEAVAHLESDPARVVEGVDNFLRWNQQLIDDTIAALDGTHFDIAPPLRRCEAMIAPPGGAAAMYYTGPSEDFSRPGRTWYPTLGKTTFPLWREVSICYHEGVPGHHLQIAQVMYLADTLTRFQRLAGFTSGHGEGWALYAERLMGELGFLDDPAYELGMLSAQAMRAVRVIVDIGMHLELTIPADEHYHPGERWTPQIALPFVIERSCFPEAFMASEVDRYLGLPGQAISYKVGERVWLDARDDARARHGSTFDLKDFHRYALDLGGMGLDQLARELATY